MDFFTTCPWKVFWRVQLHQPVVHPCRRKGFYLVWHFGMSILSTITFEHWLTSWRNTFRLRNIYVIIMRGNNFEPYPFMQIIPPPKVYSLGFILTCLIFVRELGKSSLELASFDRRGTTASFGRLAAAKPSIHSLTCCNANFSSQTLITESSPVVT